MRELLVIVEGAVWIQRHCVLLELKKLYALAAVQHKGARRNESKQRSGDLSPDAGILEVESLYTHLQLLKLAFSKVKYCELYRPDELELSDSGLDRD